MVRTGSRKIVVIVTNGAKVTEDERISNIAGTQKEEKSAVIEYLRGVAGSIQKTDTEKK